MSTPAGWYDDGQGSLRYWDGQAWTEHTQPLPPAAPVDAAPAAPAAPAAEEPAGSPEQEPEEADDDPVTGLAATQPLPIGGIAMQPTETLPVQSDLRGWGAPGAVAEPPASIPPAAATPTAAAAYAPAPERTGGGRGLLVTGLVLLGVGLVAVIAGAVLLLTWGDGAGATRAGAATTVETDETTGTELADPTTDLTAGSTKEATADADVASEPTTEPGDADEETDETSEVAGGSVPEAEDVAERFAYAWGTGDCATEYALSSEAWTWGATEDEYCEGSIGDLGLVDAVAIASALHGDVAVVVVEETTDYGDGFTSTDAWEYTLVQTADGWRVESLDVAD